MNKLLIQNGGMPFEGNDLLFMQEGFRDAIKGTMRLFGEPYGGNIILSGLDYEDNGTSLIVSEGYVLFDYEVLYYSQTMHPTGTNPNSVSIRREIVYDPAGLDTFADSTTKDTYEIRRARSYIGLQDSSNELVLLSAPRMKDEIYNISLSRKVIVPIASFNENWQGTNVKVYKNDNIIRLSGEIKNGSTGTRLFTLPVGFRPSSIIDIPVAIGVGFSIGLLHIYTTGVIEVYHSTAIVLSETQSIYLNGVSFIV